MGLWYLGFVVVHVLGRLYTPPLVVALVVLIIDLVMVGCRGHSKGYKRSSILSPKTRGPADT